MERAIFRIFKKLDFSAIMPELMYTVSNAKIGFNKIVTRSLHFCYN